jgi:DNA polymerase III delta prime subunit
VLERDLKTVTSVEATKEFLRGAQISPFEAGAQVFVVASAETLSGEAANALLKTLEEPPTRAPRHFFLLTPSELDLLATLRSRSLSIFLGAGGRPHGEELDEFSAEFATAVDAYRMSGNSAELLVAAGILKQAGNFRDAAAAEPWERAATVVLRSASQAEATEYRRRLLALAQDLLDAPPLRLRGISPERLLEGRLHLRFAPGGRSSLHES